MSTNNTASISHQCSHCGESTNDNIQLKLNNLNHYFCCHGCKTVYQILEQNKLQKYYQLREDSYSRPVNIQNLEFAYLDQQNFIQKYANEDGEFISIDFFLEGVHCVACLWLIEKLPSILKQVVDTKLNMSTNVVSIKLKKNSILSEVAQKLAILGYKPHPVLNKSDIQELAKKEDRKALTQIAIAFTCAGNIMLLSFSIYGGATGDYATHFNWYSFLLMLPILFYSATPFYKSALSALRNKKLSIDIPIVVALIVGTITGVFNIYTGSEHLYFDSLSTLVFLLLGARYILKKAQQKTLNTAEIASFFKNNITHRFNKDTNQYEDVHSQFLEQYDIIEIRPNEMIPADGLILNGQSYLDKSLLTGESLPIKVSKGEYVYSGTINLENNLKVQVLNTDEHTRLGKILKQVELGWNKKTQIVTFADNLSKYFVSIVFSLAIITFFVSIYLIGIYEEAFIRSLTLIIITCPCALGLTTPLALTLTLSRLAKKGIIIKDETIIEKLSNAKKIFLDKTGTLTHGKFHIASWKDLDDSIDSKNIIYSLEKNSKHPIAQALVLYLEKNVEGLKSITLKDKKQISGKGISGYINNDFFELKARSHSSEDHLTKVGLYKNSELITEISLEDEIRQDAKKSIGKLKKLGLEVCVISGDSNGPVKYLAQNLNLEEKEYRSNMSPEEKLEILNQSHETIMVGDGANDAMALSKSYVGIAVRDSVDISLRAADIYLSNTGVSLIVSTIVAAKETMRVIKRNLGFSLIYNLIGATLAIMGHITPLMAAILMPLSSITVLLSTVISTKKLRTIYSKH